MSLRVFCFFLTAVGLSRRVYDIVVTLPQEYFDLIERTAVSKPPQRVINPRYVRGVIDICYPLTSRL